MSVDSKRDEEVWERVSYLSWDLETITHLPPSIRKPEPLKPPSSKIYLALRELQSALRQKQLADPNLSQQRIFSFCAPLFVFLCAFVLGVLVPRNPLLKAQVVDLLDGGMSELATALLLLGSGVLGGLLALRGAIWVVARLATSFCEMDLRGLEERKIDAGDAFALTPANLIVGGLLN